MCVSRITAPSLRKRKAIDLSDHTSSSAKSGSDRKGTSTTQTKRPKLLTKSSSPPRSRETRQSTSLSARSASRQTWQAAEAVVGGEVGSPPLSEVRAAAALKVVPLQTPATTHMDSDDDVLSFASSEANEDFGDQDSDISIQGAWDAASSNAKYSVFIAYDAGC